MFKIIKKKNDGSEIVESVFCDGAKFDRFNLILPKKSKVIRLDPGLFKVETPKLSILFEVDFEGFNSVMPYLFMEKYLKLDDCINERIVAYKIYINIQINIKLRSLFSWNGWEYHRWIDSFLATLDDNINKDSFFEKIDWKRIEALLRTMSSKKNRVNTNQHSNEEIASTIEKKEIESQNN